jgi:hypothetical protein
VPLIMPTGAVDTFTGSNGAAWNSTNWATALNQGSGGGVTIQGNQGRIATGTTSGNRTSVRLLTAARLDAEVLFDWVVPTALSQFAAIWFRTPSAVDTAYGYYFTLEPNDMGVGWAVSTNPYIGTDIATFTHGFTAGQVVRTRIAVFGGTGTKTLKARSWLASGTEDTSTWQISTTDTHTINTANFIGLTTSAGSAGSKQFFIDNFSAYDTETPSQKTIAVAGSITASGALIKVIPKTFAGSVTASGALLIKRVVVRAFAGSIAPTGALIKVPVKTLAGSLTPVGTFAKTGQKVLGGSIAPIGTFTKFSRKKFAGSITPVGNVVMNFIGRVFGVPGIVVVSVRKAGELRARFRRT